jgi:hypothetical protein
VTLVLDIDERRKIPASPPYPAPEVTAELDPMEIAMTANSNPRSMRSMFDGNLESSWESNRDKRRKNEATEYPYILDFELEDVEPINGFKYARKEDRTRVYPKDYELYVGRSKDDFGRPVAKGSFADTNGLQKIAFRPVKGRHVRLKLLNAFKADEQRARIAELRLLRDLGANGS